MLAPVYTPEYFAEAQLAAGVGSDSSSSTGQGSGTGLVSVRRMVELQKERMHREIEQLDTPIAQQPLQVIQHFKAWSRRIAADEKSLHKQVRFTSPRTQSAQTQYVNEAQLTKMKQKQEVKIAAGAQQHYQYDIEELKKEVGFNPAAGIQLGSQRDEGLLWFDNQPVTYGHGSSTAGGAAEFNLHKPALRDPDRQVTMMAGGCVDLSMQYNKSMATFMGEDMAMEVGGAELAVTEVMKPDNKDRFKIAHEREISQMAERRFVRPGDEGSEHESFVPVDQLTDIQKKGAMRCRLSYTEKRTELQDEKSTAELAEAGVAKARLVAKDLKVIKKKAKTMTYSPTPSAEAFRLVVASTKYKLGHKLSSSDFDVAFLQSFKWKDGKLVLISYYDAFLGHDVYEWISGVIYGMQEGGADWHNTLAYRLTTELGFKEVRNMESMYHHSEQQLTIPCHVDDPLIKSVTDEGMDWFHTNINRMFDTKGRKVLTIQMALDYLSIRISLDKLFNIRLDNEVKIQCYLQELGLADCNPGNEPITKSTVIELYEQEQAGNFEAVEDQEMVGHFLGAAQWLAATTTPVIATAVSLLASLTKKRPMGSVEAIHKLFRFIKGIQKHCLMSKADCNSGIQVSSDADWAGMYSWIGELRSRTGILVTYDGMPVMWRSCYQQCKSTEIPSGTPLDLIATSSAESEVYAAADAAKIAKHLMYVCQETDIPHPEKVVICIDAGAAMGFIQNTGTIGRMKHIDLRQGWLDMLRCRNELDWHRIPGEQNPADFFTKVLTGKKFKESLDYMMTPM